MVKISRNLVSIPVVDAAKFNVVSSPPRAGEGSWSGAPSAVYDYSTETFWLVYRVRDPVERGIEIHIARSSDGSRFKDVQVIRKEDFEGRAISVERSSILIDPMTGRFKLYVSMEADFAGGSRPRGRGARGRWVIGKLDDARDPEDFDASTFRIVLAPSLRGEDYAGVKDPYVAVLGRSFLMYYIGGGGREQVFLAFSNDGEKWERSPRSVFGVGGWHDFATRPCSLLPVRSGFLLYYGGSSSGWYAPVYNIAVGAAFTADFWRIADLTPTRPLLTSATPGKYVTFRYLDVLPVEDRLYFYYEAARPDDAFELRVSVCSGEDF